MIRFALGTALSLLVMVVPAFAEDAASAFKAAQQAYFQKDYGRALKHINAYLAAAKASDKRRFGVIEQGARIHLQHRRDPQAAVAFLEKAKKRVKLSAADRKDIEEWLATAREWRKMGALAPTDNADKLFTLGQRYYRKGTDIEDNDDGVASRYIAAGYLVPFVSNFDRDPRLPKALLMLGDIRRRSWKPEEWWTVDFYLKEVIRRFPGTPEAQQAFHMLKEDIQMRWSGSSGDRTPDYLKAMLTTYRALAFGGNKPKARTSRKTK